MLRPLSFILGGQRFQIGSLDPAIDAAFISLHAAFLTSASHSWHSFASDAHAYLSKTGVGVDEHDQFFNNFTIPWRHYLTSSRFDRAEEIWEMAIGLAWDWERVNSNRTIHKGTPYYFWGMTVILRGDLDRGYGLMHQALEEDVRATGQTFPDTPALALATLNSEKLDQFFRPWVHAKAALASRFLNTYQSTHARHLDFSGLNSRFLQHPPSSHAVYSLSYVLGRLVKFAGAPQPVFENDFAAQLHMDLLFRLALVVDAAIKAKNASASKFIEHAEFLSASAGLGLSRADLQDVNTRCYSDFETALTELVSGTFCLPRGATISGLDRDLSVTYACRNYAAHNVGPIAVVRRRASDVQQCVFNTLFLVVETLY